MFPSKRANASVLERTPNLAILATESGAEAGLGVLLGDPLGVSRRVARSNERQPLLAQAREILERLEAKPWLERLGQQSSVGRETEPVTAGS